jgi:arylsulfatase A-like enzyme
LRRGLALASLLLLAACSGGSSDEEWGGPESLSFQGAHLLLVSLDTLRADRLGCYGYDRDTSPVLDALAAESVLFEQVYSHSPKTASAHMSLFTSLLPSVHKVRNFSARLGLELTNLPSNRLTLAQILNQSGYWNAAVTSGGNIRPDMGFKRGFRGRFEGVMDDFSNHVARSLQRWDEALASGAPGFVFLHTYQVHGPYLPPPEFMDRFAAEPSGVIVDRVEALKDLPFQQQWAAMNKTFQGNPPFWGGREDFGPDEAAYMSDLYDGEVAYTDSQLGVLLDGLRERDLLDRMIIVVLSDHGEEFYEHGDFEHDQLYREHLHVPLLVRLPGGRRGGTRVRGQAGLIDVMPTLLELLELPASPTMTGESLVPAITSGRTSNKPVVAERVMFQPTEYSATLRTPQHTVMFVAEELGAPGELRAYDLRADPAEVDDIFDTGDFSSQAAEALRAELVRAFSGREELDKVDSGEVIRLDDPAAVKELESLGYVGSGAAPAEIEITGTPLERWPEDG